ncbi:NAD(P)/FAD-dependent oxidoreductase [Paraliobacillus sp. JSM ZJ581]|uniref:NAD(P)/FAD-dependent oxidoreductase n=1 Tax=Paraliobacillus sp. JSM ZJ581 TaxID=3342118 RepID=UPI0035A9354C
MTTNTTYDVTIIGGGPAGLFAAFYSGLRGLKTKVIEFQPYLGGKVHVYPEKMVWDVGSVPPLTGAQLIEQMIEQGLTFDPTVILNTKVTSITQDKHNIFHLHTNEDITHYSKTVIVAIGGGILQPQRLELKHISHFEQTNLHYLMKPLTYFKNKDILISGGGHSAIDWAAELEPLVNKIYLTYRGDTFRGHETVTEKVLSSEKVTSFFETNITKFISSDSGNTIEQVELTETESNKKHLIAVDDVIVHHGYIRDNSLLQDSPLQINLHDDYFIMGSSLSESSVEGLYAAGDILHHDGKLHLIAGAYQDAANAINMAKRYLDPEASKHAMVSSHNDKFKQKNKAIIEQQMK